jgi:hypothetical protein
MPGDAVSVESGVGDEDGEDAKPGDAAIVESGLGDEGLHRDGGADGLTETVAP